MASFLDEAADELDAVADYLEDERTGYGARFLLEVEHALASIDAFPEAAPRVIGSAVPEGIRRIILATFPYGIVYAEPERVILAVAHLHRRPQYWKERLRQVPP